MDRNAIAVLAKGLVPFVREVVTEAVAEPIARIAVLEARPIEKGDAGERGPSGQQGPPGPKGDSGELAMLPPELAGQVASAVRLLHESPALEQRSESPRPSSKVTRIERDADGNFVPVYEPALAGETKP
jgi:hypothetical protein